MTVKCDRCKLEIEGKSENSFMLLEKRIDLCNSCAKEFKAALFDDD